MHRILTQDIRDEILRQINASQNEIFAVVSWFTDSSIFDALHKAVVRDVRVFLITQDDEINTNGGLDFNKLSASGATVYLYDGAKGGILHHKFCVLDRKIVIHGSYNWTFNAATVNHESVTVFEGPKAPVDELLEEFDNIRRKPQIHKLKQNNYVYYPEMVQITGGNIFFENVERYVSSFDIGKYPITFEEYYSFCLDVGKRKPGDTWYPRNEMPSRPVVFVSWFDAIEYCNWLSKQQGLSPLYSIDDNVVKINWENNGYRLPIELEWEYAAREGGKDIKFGNGKNVANSSEINFIDSWASQRKSLKASDNWGQTTPVGHLKCPNSMGLHDMSGNVWEWCWDDFYSPTRDVWQSINNGTFCALRGGAYNSSIKEIEVTFRRGHSCHKNDGNIGFRIVKNDGGIEGLLKARGLSLAPDVTI